jgi:DNA repair protein RecO (recombination protein O)
MAAARSELPAIVLDSYDHGESDKIVSFFCQGAGRITGIAKGALRSRKRFVNKLELFSFLQISYSRRNPASLAVITDAELLNGFVGLRTSFPHYQGASIVREFALLATSEKLSDDNLFRLSLWALHSLDGKEDPKTVLALFLVKLFDAIGYRPDLSKCQGCGSEYKNKGMARFNAHAGGLICSRCQGGHGGGWRLTPGTIQMMISIQQQPLDRLGRFKMARPMQKEVLDCLYRYGRHLFQKDIHSWKCLASL